MMRVEDSRVEVLKSIKSNFPEIVRMIVTNAPKDKKIINILFEGFAKTIVPINPTPKTTLLMKNIIRIRSEIESDEVKQFIMSLDALPSLPTLYYELTTAVREDKDMSYIAKIIKKEPSLSADIIKTVNSPAYNIETSSIQTALSFLGMNSIKDFIVSFSAFNEDLVPKKSLPYLKIIQEHSRLTNEMTHKMYQFLFNRKIDKDIASVPLIGNIGLILLLKSDHNKFVEYLERLKEFDDYNYEDLDDEIFNMTHSKLGGYLFNWWELPVFTVDSVLNHHKDFIINPDISQFVEAFKVADIISWQKLGYLKKVEIDERYADIFLSPQQLKEKQQKLAMEERKAMEQKRESEPVKEVKSEKRKKSLFEKIFSIFSK
jgi:HD-like signal output (HDOD) protein